MTQWRLIESAPKDGTLILLAGGTVDDHYPPEGMETRIVTGWWHQPEYGEPAWRHCTYDSDYYGEYGSPTHWMPAPNPPEAV